MANPPQTGTSHATGGTAPRLYETRNDIPKESRAAVVRLLNQRLADTVDLHMQAKQAHWNVKGSDFYQLHLLFDDVAAKVEPHIDSLAERVTALGGVAQGTVRMAADGTTLNEFPTDPPEGRAYLEALAERFATVAEGLRHSIDESAEKGDQGTADLFTAIVRDVDEGLYFLESHLQRS